MPRHLSDLIYAGGVMDSFKRKIPYSEISEIEVEGAGVEKHGGTYFLGHALSH